MNTALNISAPTLHPVPAPASAHDAVRMQPPATQELLHVMRVEQPMYWPDANTASLGKDEDHARQVMQKPRTMQHFGQAFGQAHTRALKMTVPTTDLKTRVSAESTWRAISENSALSTLSPIEPRAALQATQTLGDALWASTSERVQTAYNIYPGVLRVYDDGTIVNVPNHTSSGFHAWFEPLARLDYTSRTPVDSLRALVDAYADARHDVPADKKATWQRDAMQCRVLMDIQYIGYFLKFMPDLLARPETLTGEAAGSISRLQALVPRLRSDVAWLATIDSNTPDMHYVPQHYLQNL